MTATIELVQTSVWGTENDTLDLMGGLTSSTGYVVESNGWIQQIAAPGETKVTEVLSLRVKGSSSDNLAGELQKLDALITQVNRHALNPNFEDAVWLRVKMHGESQERQAMILRMFSDKLPVLNLETQLMSDVSNFTLTIERTPYWEDTVYVAAPAASAVTAISCNGGKKALGTKVVGDVAARVLRLGIYPDSTYTFRQFWIGFRTGRRGITPANMVTAWDLTDCNSGTFSADTSVSGDHLVTTFSTPTNAQRFAIAVQDVSANAEDQVGTFLVLLRAATSDDTAVIRVRMKYGFLFGSTIANPVTRGPTKITSESPKLYEVGTVDLGTFGIALGGIELMTIALDAELISGSASLSCYEFILIPIDEGGVSLTSNADLSSSVTRYASIFQDEKDHSVGYSVLGAYTSPDIGPDSTCKVTPYDWGAPVDDSAPTIVVAGQGATSHTTTHTVTIEYSFAQRWRTLRGNQPPP